MYKSDRELRITGSEVQQTSDLCGAVFPGMLSCRRRVIHLSPSGPERPRGREVRDVALDVVPATSG